tara:strand:- start:10 stop:702 length:693 start_codon:yes stop_codon:yes gene_type:complete
MAEIPEQSPEEGSKMIIRIHAIDQAGNRVEVPSDEITIQCTVGSVRHLSDDTYEVSVDQAGQSQSCNAYWNDLVAQRFFDVNAVLFGGGLGDSNTALTMVSIIVFLFISIMVVLIRRIKGEENDEDYWGDDDEEYEKEYEDDYSESETVIETVTETETVVVAKEEEVVEDDSDKKSKEQLRQHLADEAKRTGVMQAAPGTEQGKTGWYIDSSGELTSWLVTESGEWTRMS